MNESWLEVGRAYMGQSPTGGSWPKSPKSSTENPPKGHSNLPVALIPKQASFPSLTFHL